MKESEFVEQNKQKWTDFEKKLNAGDWKPESISRHYIRTIDDLSYARSHYPNRLVRYYLNGVIQVLSLKIYRSQSRYWKGIKEFWSRDLPLVMHEARLEFLLSFLILAVSVGIGIISSMNDDSFAAFILGEDYIQRTLENIEKGDPMAVYKDSGQTEMFFGITYNNIMVSAYTYALSLFFGAGTLLVIVYNGVMLGVFQYFFIERGLFFESFLTIWQHGVVEISCIVLAGTAGLVLARGLLFPGTLSRIDAFRFAGRKSLIIMLGLMPLLVYSGAIEAAVTRYTEMHWAIRLSTILLSLGFVFGYFVFYARKVARRYDIAEEMNMYIQPMKPFKFSYNDIEKNASILWKALGLVIRNRKPFLLSGLALSAVASVIYFLIFTVEGTSGYPTHSALKFFYTDLILDRVVTVALVVLASTIMAHWSIYKDRKAKVQEAIPRKPFFARIILSGLVTALVTTALVTTNWLFLLLAAVLPILGLFIMSSWQGQFRLNKPFKISFDLLSKHYFKPLGLLLIHIFMTYLLIMVVQELGWYILTQLMDSFIGYFEYMALLKSVLSLTLSVFILYYFYTVSFASLGLSYFSLFEMRNATELGQRIQHHFPDLDANPSKNTGLLASNKLYRS